MTKNYFATTLFLLCIFITTDAFTTVTSFHGKGMHSLEKRVSVSTRSTALKMEIDQNTVLAVAAGAAGLLGGLGLVAFTENQGIRSEERGAISENLRTDLSGKLLEDVEVQRNDVDDLVSRMSSALAEAKGVDEKDVVAEMTEEEKKKKKEEQDDGW
mmetsp:Transcript_23345/g.30485  ORF Transcript_23345/g.30485 Transcript_23345/m.30485 type:complete len:157 (+) Transcript_23345:85-555(+)